MNEPIRAIIQHEIAMAKKDALYSTENKSAATHNGIDAPKISYKNLTERIPYFAIATTTNGTTAVNVFNPSFMYGFTITSVMAISQDTTAANITLTNNGNTVVAIAKGTTAGLVTGGTGLANTSYKAGTPLSVVSSSAGNATVVITFTVI